MLKNKKLIWGISILIIVIIAGIVIKNSIYKVLYGGLSQPMKFERIMKKDIAAIPDEDLAYAVMNWMWGKFNSDWSNEYEVITSLPEPCQNIYSVYTVEGEVNNGGFNQCYYNSSRAFTQMAVKGFRAIGAEGFSDIMTKANTLYDEIKEDLEQYYDGTIESFSKSYENNPLNELDDEFMEQYEKEPLDKLYIDYIREHAEFFGD